MRRRRKRAKRRKKKIKRREEGKDIILLSLHKDGIIKRIIDVAK